MDQRFESARLRLSATWFDERLEDEINGFVYDPGRGGFTAENEDGSSRRKGLEIEGDWRASDAFTLGFAWSWLNAREPDPLGEGSGTEIRRPERTAGLRVRWVPAGTRLDLGLRIDHSSSQDDFFFPPEPPFQQRVTLEEFTLVSLSASWDLRRSVSVFGRVDNALDASYEEVLGFRGAGRQGIIGVRYRFDADR
jgi:vitamin B12 transporter